MKKSPFSFLAIILLLSSLTACVNRSERMTPKERRMARHAKNTQVGEFYPMRIHSKPYEICYVSKGEMFFHDIASTETLKLPEEKPVFNFAFSEDKSTLFYTVVAYDSLFLKKAVFKDATVNIMELIPLNQGVGFFTSQTYTEKGDMWVTAGTVFLECNYVMEIKGFSSFVRCVISEEYKQLNIEMIAERMKNEMKVMMKDEDAKFMKSVMEAKMKGFTDLYMMSNNQPIKLTDINLIIERIRDETEGELNENILGDVEMWLWLRERDTIHNVFDLCMTVDETNTPVVIAEDVDYFVLRDTDQ
jgi:hypothetical protein